jgi:hypothetical protein
VESVAKVKPGALGPKFLILRNLKSSRSPPRVGSSRSWPLVVSLGCGPQNFGLTAIGQRGAIHLWASLSDSGATTLPKLSNITPEPPSSSQMSLNFGKSSFTRSS